MYGNNGAVGHLLVKKRNLLFSYTIRTIFHVRSLHSRIEFSSLRYKNNEKEKFTKIYVKPSVKDYTLKNGFVGILLISQVYYMTKYIILCISEVCIHNTAIRN